MNLPLAMFLLKLMQCKGIASDVVVEHILTYILH